MRKLLSIVLALTLVLGMLPVFADGLTFNVEPTGAKNLKHYGFIGGDENGNLKENEVLTREQLAVILATLHGKFDEAKAFAAESGFADEKTFPAWSKNFISFAKGQKWLLGNDKNMFDAKGVVSDEMLASVLLRVLGYELPAWGQNVATLKEKTNITVSGASLMRGDAFEAMWLAVSTPVMMVKEGDQPKYLGVELGKLDIAIITPPVVDLAIDEVKADNLKEVMVKFNQKLNKDELGSFSINKSDVAFTAELMEDGMTVKLTLVPEKATSADQNPKLDNQKTYKLTVAKTKAENEKVEALAKTVVNLDVFDKEIPTVKNVEFVGPRTIKVTFSEPIVKDANTKLEIKKGNGTIAVNNSKIETSGNTALISAFQDLTDGTEYTIFVKNFKDYAGYTSQNHEGQYTFSLDKTAPVVEDVKATSSYAIVKFSKPVMGVAATSFAHTFTGWNAKEVLNEVGGKKLEAGKAYQEVVAVFYKGDDNDKALSGNVKFMIFGNNKSQIKDLWGNKLVDQELMVAVSADNEAPTVAYKVLDSKNIRLTFSEPVTVAKKNINVYDTKGNNIYFTFDAASEKVVVISFTKSMEKQEVVLDIKGVTDKSPNANKMADYKETVSFGDTQPPKVEKVLLKKAANGNPAELYFFYSEDVDAAAEVAANYQLALNNVFTKLTNDGSFFNGNKVVRFILTADEAKKVAIGQKVLVSNVKDTAGHALVMNLVGPIEAFEVKTVPTIEKVVADGMKQYYVVFSDEISEFDPSKFKLAQKNDHVAINNPIVGSELMNTKTVRIYLEKDIQGFVDNADNIAKFYIEKDAVKNAFGTGNDAVAADPGKEFVINVAPVADLEKATYVVKDRKVTIPFNMELNESAAVDETVIVANDLVVMVDGERVNADKITLTALNGTSKNLEFTISEDQLKETSRVITVSTSSNVTYISADAGKTPIKAFTKTFEIDNAMPRITSITFDEATAGNKVVVTFNKPLKEGTAPETGHVQFGGTATAPTVGNVVLNDTRTKLTITFTTQDLKAGTTITLTANHFKGENELPLFSEAVDGEQQANHNVWIIKALDAKMFVD